MDGNFVDNDIGSIIESAGTLPMRNVGGANGSVPVNPPNKYDKFQLRIKFNNNLDPKTVNVENAIMMQDAKKPVKTDIKYDENKQSIIVNPKSKYLKNHLYVLKISGKVMSEKGRSLRKHRFFAFRHDGTSLNFYKDFNGNLGVAPDQLLAQRSYVLPISFAVSALVLVGAYLGGSKSGLILGTALVLIATLAAFVDSISDYSKSQKEYLYGAKLYNQGFYFEAIESFELALHYYADNGYAKYGLDAAIVKSSKV